MRVFDVVTPEELEGLVKLFVRAKNDLGGDVEIHIRGDLPEVNYGYLAPATLNLPEKTWEAPTFEDHLLDGDV